MTGPQRRGAPRGFTLIEMMISTVISLVVVALATGALIAMDRDSAYRTQITSLQGWTRFALDVMLNDMRHAGLGVGDQGVVWMDSGGGSVNRPAVQIFADLGNSGGVVTDAKPQTDALLLVEAIDATTRAATTSQMDASNWAALGGAIPVTAGTGFNVGDAILMSNGSQASWGVLTTVNPGSPATLTLASLTNVLPPAIGNQVGQPTVLLKAGSPVRRARSRLYYVDNNDELVQLTLSVPRSPASAPEVISRTVLAQGFENMKIDCTVDAGISVAFGACPSTSIVAGDAVQAEAVTTFGNFFGSGGPLFTTTGAGPDISTLRTITVTVSVHGRYSVGSGQADQPVALQGALDSVMSAPAVAGDYIRRTYAISAAVRNNTLGVL